MHKLSCAFIGSKLLTSNTPSMFASTRSAHLTHSLTVNLALNVTPYLKNSQGTGTNANEMNPSKELPHPSPRAP